MGEHEHGRAREAPTPTSHPEPIGGDRLARRPAGPSAPAAPASTGTRDPHAAFTSAVSAGIHADVAAVTHVSHRTEDFPLDQSLDEAGIGALSTGGDFNWGLTVGAPQGAVHLNVAAAAAGGFGVSNLGVELHYAERKKYVSRNAPAGGRRFAVIDEHEQRHVQDFQTRLAREDTQFPQRIAETGFPTVTNPIAVADHAAAVTAIRPLVDAALLHARQAFRAELVAAQHHIDEPDAETARAQLALLGMNPEVMRGPFSDGDPSPAVAYAATPGELFVEGVRAQDVVQGQLADCYFAAALASVAGTQPGVIRAMIQPAGGRDYRVRFFRWEGDRRTEHTVVVDDHLPHTAGGRLGYMRSSEAAPGGGVELWPMIAEKAYAQFRGGYDDIGDGGQASAALTAITGTHPTEVSRSGSRDGSRFTLMTEAVRGGQPVVMTTRRDIAHEEILRVGIYGWHSYPVIGTDPSARTVRLRNVWGHRFSMADAPLAAARGLTDDAEFAVSFDVFDNVAADVAM